MANYNQIMIKIIASLFLVSTLSCTSAVILPKPQNKHIDVVVEGVVVCQRCHLNRTSSLKDATPISGAIISVNCKDKLKKTIFVANQNGYFYAKLDGFSKMGISSSSMHLEYPIQVCSVKLVKSPQVSCNVTTNINYGVKGTVPLRYMNKRVVRGAYEAVIYTAGPLAFRPARCMENQY